MIDITDLQVEDGAPHSHVAVIGEDMIPVQIEPGVLMDIVEDAKANNYHLYEVVSRDRVPCLAFGGEASVGCRFLQAVMKRLYNAGGVTLALSNPSSGESMPNPVGVGQLLVVPMVHVQPEQMKEIEEIFEALCTYRSLEFQKVTITHIPLTWEATAYKDGSEMDPDVVLPKAVPMTLSAYAPGPAITGIQRVQMTKAQMKRAALVDAILMHAKEEIITDQEKARQLVPMLSRDRSRDMALFLGVGRCLHRIFKGDGEGLDLWREASIPEMQDVCDEYWPVMETTSTYYRINTLQHWAKMDSPDKYKEWSSTSVHASLEASVLSTGGDLDVAKVAYRKNPTLFICAGQDEAKAVFYMFNGTYYKPCGTFEVKKYLIEVVIPEYEEFNRDLNKIMDANVGADSSFVQMMEDKIKACRTIVKRLKSSTYQTAVTKELMLLYNLPGFNLIKDSNPALTPFEDCVLDVAPGSSLGDSKPCIRPGVPEDYCTVSTGWSLLPFWEEVNGWVDQDEESPTCGQNNPWAHPDVKELMFHLERIIRDQDKREFLLREDASCLHASNPRKRGVAVVGDTNNAKSALYALKSMAFGPTFAPGLPGHLLCSAAPPPGQATPELEPLRHARFLIQMEVSDLMVLNEDLFKRITGCVDKLTSRALYGEMIPFIPHAKPHVVGNTLPKINGNSPAMCTRFYVVVLDSRFLFRSSRDQAYQRVKDMDQEEQEAYMAERGWFWADVSFDTIIRRIYRAYMWVLIQTYIQHSMARDGKPGYYNVPMENPPKVVEDSTIKYFTENNLFLQFLRARVKMFPEAPGVTTYTLHSAYSAWFRETINRRDSPVSLDKFINELRLMGFESQNSVYRGLVLVNNMA